MQQQGLFDETLPAEIGEIEPAPPHGPEKRGPRSARSAGVAAVTPAGAVTQLAAQLDTRLHLGTSSWSFPGWNGLVYNGDYRESVLARNGLAAYSVHPLLRCVGIDRTFYAPIAENDFRRYASQVGPQFRFMVKAPMAITSAYVRDDAGNFSDSPHFLDVSYAIHEFIAPATQGLGDKTGPLVFQFPPMGRAVREPDRFINRLYHFLKSLPNGPLYAVEVRDPELLTHRFFMCLKTTGASFCVASHARMPAPREQIDMAREVLGAGLFVARWSLHSGFKYEDAKSRYFPFNRLVDEDTDSRESLAQASAAAIEVGFPVYIVVNNKAEGSAPLSIERLAQRIAELAATRRLKSG